MAKKILITVASSLAILLVLILIVTLLLSYREFFGQAVTILLCVCIAVLAVFTIYIAVSRVADAIKRRGSDEEELSEHKIEKLLSAETIRQKNFSRPQGVGDAQGEHAQGEYAQGEPQAKKPEKGPRRKLLGKGKEKAKQKQAKQEAIRAAKADAKLRRQKEEQEKRLAAAEARAQHIAAAEEAARKRAEQEANEQEKQQALAEADALQRASQEAQEKLAVEEAAHKQVEQQLEAEQKAEEERKQQAVESARKQAEAAAAARRRAAQIAARSQTFPAITADHLPAFNTNVIEKTADVTDSRNHLFPVAGQTGGYEPGHQAIGQTGNVWEKMQVRQSAAPVLSHREPVSETAELKRPAPLPPVAEFTGEIGSVEENLSQREPPVLLPAQPVAPVPVEQPESPLRVAPEEPAAYQTSRIQLIESTAEPAGQQAYHPQPVQAPSEQVVTPRQILEERSQQVETGQQPATASGWIYEPAKPPKAWNAEGVDRKIPGDMSFSGVPITPVEEPAAADQPKKRGRPPKPKTEEELAQLAQPKRPRGRPPKPKTEEELNQPKRPRGRPPKPKTEEELNKPKRPRGRPPKPKTEEELNKPKRPRGRPRKNPLPEETPAAAAPSSSPPDRLAENPLDILNTTGTDTSV